MLKRQNPKNPAFGPKSAFRNRFGAKKSVGALQRLYEKVFHGATLFRNRERLTREPLLVQGQAKQARTGSENELFSVFFGFFPVLPSAPFSSLPQLFPVNRSSRLRF